jgi:predicted nucleic acid-binding protein
VDRRHNTCRHRAAKTEGIADRNHPVADPHIAVVAEFDARQIAHAVDLQEGDVGVLIRAYDLGLEFAAVGQVDGDLVAAVNNVVVGHDVAV